jgi:hypothetical protein
MVMRPDPPRKTAGRDLPPRTVRSAYDRLNSYHSRRVADLFTGKYRPSQRVMLAERSGNPRRRDRPPKGALRKVWRQQHELPATPGRLPAASSGCFCRHLPSCLPPATNIKPGGETHA